jgi:hypothetical protein
MSLKWSHLLASSGESGKIPPQPQAKDAPWHLANRNKRGMTLDLKSPDAGQVLKRLVKWADVLIFNTLHAARESLFGRHVGECACDCLWRPGRLALARQRRGDPEPGQLHFPRGVIHQDVGGLDVLVTSPR